MTRTRVRISHMTGTGMPVIAIPDLVILVGNMLAEVDCDALAELHAVLVRLLAEAIEKGPQ